MTNDEFISVVSDALGRINKAFRFFGIEPPKEMILRSKDDFYKLMGIRPTVSWGAIDPTGPDIACKIRDVEFRVRPSAVDRADQRAEDLRKQLEQLQQKHFLEVLALVNAAGGEVEVDPYHLHDAPKQTIHRHSHPLGGMTFKVVRN